MTTTPSGAQFEILVDGKPRSYRDMKIAAPFATQRQAAAASLPPIREPSFPSGAG
jgi:hypothetical protein